jgi:hypothetical protein
MLHPSTKRLIDKLSEMTRKQRVAWSEGQNGTITHDTEGYRVILTPEPHAVLLTDALGKEIESCTPDEFLDETDTAGRPYIVFVADLYREAHRHARGAEKAIHTVLKGLETVEAEPEAEPAIAMDPAQLIEDPVDDTDSLPEAYPEVEGQNDMARAVASMADQVNGGVSEPEDEPEIAAETEAGVGIDTVDKVEAEPEPVIESLFDTEESVEAVIEAARSDAPDLDVSEDAADAPAATEAEEISSQIASLSPDHHNVDTDAGTGTEALPEEDTLWPADENAPEPQAEPNMAPAEAPEPVEPVETETAADPAPETAPEIAAVQSDPEPYTPAFTNFDAPAQPDDPALETTGDADVAPPAPRSFSLSGISSGFGLGSAGRASAPVPGPASERAESKTSTDRPHMVIDGTLDLPDDIPLSEFDAGPDAPAYPDLITDAAEEPFPVSESASASETEVEESAPEPAPSKPEEQAFEVPAQTAEPEEAEEPASESPPRAPKVTTRFNPWN